ncbi:hypothetical protein [Microcoleus sp.]|uniref:hypothetical protein n=1 Tax=Microcoleus sp. TaxID=44472 RepID=UPI003524E560
MSPQNPVVELVKLFKQRLDYLDSRTSVLENQIRSNSAETEFSQRFQELISLLETLPQTPPTQNP